MRKIGFVVAGLLCAALLFPASAKAAFPERDITLVVPWAAGGGTDTLARTLEKNGKKYFGVNINVQNVTGGTGVIGMNQVARAKADLESTLKTLGVSEAVQQQLNTTNSQATTWTANYNSIFK